MSLSDIPETGEPNWGPLPSAIYDRDPDDEHYDPVIRICRAELHRRRSLMGDGLVAAERPVIRS